LLLCSIAFGVRQAHADPSAAEISNARQAFESAVALEADQKWVEATLKLRQALAVKDTPGLRFHLAHCEEQQGLLVEAALDYDRASELLRQGAKAPDVQKLLVPASAALKPRIPHVSVEIPSDVQNAVAELDGKAYAPSELALATALDPGSHQLKISARGRSAFERSFSLKEGEQISIRAELPSGPPESAVRAPGSSLSASPAQPVPSSAPVDSPKTAGTGPGSSPKLYLLLGESAVTVAGLALGIGYGLAESSARDRVQAAQGRIDQAAQDNTGACSTPGSSLGSACTDLRTAIDDHDRDATLSTVGFVAAGVGAAALLTTWLVYPSRRSDSSGPSAQPVVALGRIGLQGRF
jgi:hypothetical protein